MFGDAHSEEALEYCGKDEIRLHQVRWKCKCLLCDLRHPCHGERFRICATCPYEASPNHDEDGYADDANMRRFGPLFTFKQTSAAGTKEQSEEKDYADKEKQEHCDGLIEEIVYENFIISLAFPQGLA